MDLGRQRVQKYIVFPGDSRLILNILSCLKLIYQLCRDASGLQPVSQTLKVVVLERTLAVIYPSLLSNTVCLTDNNLVLV